MFGSIFANEKNLKTCPRRDSCLLPNLSSLVAVCKVIKEIRVNITAAHFMFPKLLVNVYQHSELNILYTNLMKLPCVYQFIPFLKRIKTQLSGKQ